VPRKEEKGWGEDKDRAEWIKTLSKLSSSTPSDEEAVESLEQSSVPWWKFAEDFESNKYPSSKINLTLLPSTLPKISEAYLLSSVMTTMSASYNTEDYSLEDIFAKVAEWREGQKDWSQAKDIAEWIKRWNNQLNKTESQSQEAFSGFGGNYARHGSYASDVFGWLSDIYSGDGNRNVDVGSRMAETMERNNFTQHNLTTDVEIDPKEIDISHLEEDYIDPVTSSIPSTNDSTLTVGNAGENVLLDAQSLEINPLNDIKMINNITSANVPSTMIPFLNDAVSATFSSTLAKTTLPIATSSYTVSSKNPTSESSVTRIPVAWLRDNPSSVQAGTASSTVSSSSAGRTTSALLIVIGTSLQAARNFRL
jgi:hypothetical protein